LSKERLAQRVFAMPRYFFHAHHFKLQLDHDGEELPDKHAT
jgi:hypothetical protein